MIYYPIFQMKTTGINDILIVTGKEHLETMVKLLGSGVRYGLNFTYKIQDQAGGIAHALSLAADYVGKDQCLVILGDNLFSNNLTKAVADFQTYQNSAQIFLKTVPDPHRYGIAEIIKEQIISIEEKPEEPKSNYCITGIYLYDSNVFEVIDSLHPSARGELEISDVNKAYLNEGRLIYQILDGWWIDAGTFESINQAQALAQNFDLNGIWN